MAAPQPPEGAEAAALLATYADQLAAAVADALPAWVERCVAERITAAGGELTGEVRAAAAAAGVAAREQVAPRVRTLLETDVDRQPTSPLALLRGAVRFHTEVLIRAGVPPVPRDEVAERLFPEDVYDLSPAAFADLGPTVHEAGVTWGAAKAHVVLARRAAEGRR